MSIECLAFAVALVLATQGAPGESPPLHKLPGAAAEPSSTAGSAQLHGVRVTGVGLHPDAGITPESIQAAADRALRDAGDGALPAHFTLGELEQVTAQITRIYREAGFLVAQAIVPPQALGDDRVLTIEVIEGRLGRVLIQGNARYREEVLAASSAGLAGRPLRGPDLETAILYARDLPGVSVTSVLQPGEHPGETDLVLVAEEARRPYTARLGVSNHGTDNTGRYRVEAGITLDNPLGAGDVLAASLGYGLDPADSWQGALSYSLPSRRVSGLSTIVGLSRSQMELNSGPFAPLEIHGPTTLGYAGADWKFVNRQDLQMQASARWIHEESRLDGLGMTLSRHKFDVLEAGFTLRHTDRRLRAINLLQLSTRKAINDESAQEDWLYPAHDSHFWVSRLSLARMQALPANQRLLLRGSAQFTGSALVPMEQFSIGGPNGVRAFPLSGALGDRGVQATLEYQVDAPGFANRPSPFGGSNWAEVLSFNLFYDWGRVSPTADNRRLGVQPVTFEGAGAGFTLRLPGQPGMQLDVSAATPTGSTKPSDGDDFRVWARLGMTF